MSAWGHDFRPDYGAIGRALRGPGADAALARAPLLALTATATPAVREDVQRSLLMRAGARVFVADFGRPNLAFCVRAKAPGGKAGFLLQVRGWGERSEPPKRA